HTDEASGRRGLGKEKRAMAMRILLAIDGSRISTKVARHAVVLCKNGLSADIVLVNVQPAPPRRAAAKAAAALYRKEGEQACQAAAAVLARARIRYRRSVRAGPVAQTLIRTAADTDCDAIVM